MVNSIIQRPVNPMRPKPLGQFQHSKCLNCSCYVPSKDEFYLGFHKYYSKALAVFEMKTRRLSFVAKIRTGVTDIDLTEDEKMIFFTTASSHCYLLSVETRQLVRCFETSQNKSNMFCSFRFSEDCNGAYLFGYHNKLSHLNFKNGQVTIIPTQTIIPADNSAFAISANKKLLYGFNINIIVGCLSLKRGFKYKTTRVEGSQYSSSCNILNQQNTFLFSTCYFDLLSITDIRTFKLRQVKSFLCDDLLETSITNITNISGYIVGALYSGYLFVMQEHNPFQVLYFLKQERAFSIDSYNINITSKYLLVWGDDINDIPNRIFANDFYKLKPLNQDS